MLSSSAVSVDKQKPKFIDLFAGIGGFGLAFEQAGYECVYSSEIDSACQEVYFNNFGEQPKGDITKIDIEEIPEFDALPLTKYINNIYQKNC